MSKVKSQRLEYVNLHRTTTHAEYQQRLKHKGCSILVFMVQYRPCCSRTKRNDRKVEYNPLAYTMLYQINNTEHGFMLFSSLIAAKQYINKHVS